MAQTSTRRNSQARRRTTGRSNGSGRSAASRSGSRSGGSRSRSGRSGGNGAAASAKPKQLAAKGKDAVAQGAQSGGKMVSSVASKMKVPVIAGGAALAGLAGGMAMQSKRDSRRKILGVRVGNGTGDFGKSLVGAGQSVGRVSENLGQFAAEMRRTREAIESGEKHRSPIEVVLQGLTARR